MKRNQLVRILKLLFAGLILYVIFSRIDVHKLIETLLQVNAVMLLMAFVTGYLIQYFACAWRWQIILYKCVGLEMGFVKLFSYYWTSMFVGYLVPANLGSDIYRVIRASEDSGAYDIHGTAVFFEKIYTFAAEILMVLASYPLVSQMITAEHPSVGSLVYRIYWIAVILGGFFTLLIIHPRIKSGLFNFFIKIFPVIPMGYWKAAELFTKWQSIVRIMVMTLGIRLITNCLGGWFLLKASGSDLPFIVHLFVWPMMSVIFKLPISVGTLGVREGAFVVLFGLFGVRPEVALTASFLGLGCLWTGVLGGGLFYLADSWRMKSDSMGLVKTEEFRK